MNEHIPSSLLKITRCLLDFKHEVEANFCALMLIRQLNVIMEKQL